MSLSECLRAVADEYFHPDTGSAEILVNEFTHTPVFVEGHRRGLADAYHILLGLSEHFETDITEVL